MNTKSKPPPPANILHTPLTSEKEFRHTLNHILQVPKHEVDEQAAAEKRQQGKPEDCQAAK